MKLEFCQQIFEKHSKIKFHDQPSSRSRVVACGRTQTDGRTDRHDKAHSRFSQFCEKFLTKIVPEGTRGRRGTERMGQWGGNAKQIVNEAVR